MKTVLILLDAFRSDYITKENTPFLHQLSLENMYIKKTKQSFGFCERSEILTGMKGKESRFITAIGLNRDKSPYNNIIFKIIRPFLKLLDYFGNEFIKKIKYKLINYSASGNLKPYFIPLDILDNFYYTEDEFDHSKRNAFKINSVLDILVNQNKSFFYESFTHLGFDSTFTSDEQRLDAVLSEIKKQNHELYLTYINSSDKYGHELGPTSPDMNKKLKLIDVMLEKFYQKAISFNKDLNFLFIGDHGMTSVKKILDIKEVIDHFATENDFKLGKDFIYFLDSTVFRLWAKSMKFKESANILLAKDIFINNGNFLSQKNADYYGVAWPNNCYGDYFWIANEGVLIFPDFFHNQKPYKGMHGYDPNLDDSCGMAILAGTEINKIEIPLLELHKLNMILKDSLEING